MTHDETIARLKATFDEVSSTDGNAPSDRPSAIKVDYNAYLHHLQDSDASDEQKRELLAALFGILVSFVDMGFDIHPYGDDSRQEAEPALDSKDTHNE